MKKDKRILGIVLRVRGDPLRSRTAKWHSQRHMDSVAAYLRVSSRTQDFATQKAADVAIERAVAARGDSVATWYSNVAESF